VPYMMLYIFAIAASPGPRDYMCFSAAIVWVNLVCFVACVDSLQRASLMVALVIYLLCYIELGFAIRQGEIGFKSFVCALC
jgi:hypothetical protein